VGITLRLLNFINNLINDVNQSPIVLTELLIWNQQFGSNRNILDWALSTSIKQVMGIGLLRHQITEGKINWITDPDLIANYTKLQSILTESELRHLLTYRIQHGELMEHLVNENLTADNIDLFMDTFSIHTTSEFTNKLVEALRNRSNSEWTASLNEGDSFIQLARVLNERKVKLELDIPLEDALRDQAESGSVNDHSDTLYEALELKAQKRLMVDIRDILLGDQSYDVEPILSHYGHDLVTWGELSDRANDLVRLVFRKIIDSNESSAVRWISIALKENPEIQTNCQVEHWSGFMTRVVNAMKDTENGESKHALNGILELFGVKEESAVTTEPEGSESVKNTGE